MPMNKGPKNRLAKGTVRRSVHLAALGFRLNQVHHMTMAASAIADSKLMASLS